MNINATALSVLFLVIEVALHVITQFATIALTNPICTRCVFNVDGRNICPNDSSFSVESDVVTAEVNIVEEEQNMWRRVKKGTKLQLDAGRRSALLLSSHRVKPHFIAESLSTSCHENTDPIQRPAGA